MLGLWVHLYLPKLILNLCKTIDLAIVLKRNFYIPIMSFNNLFQFLYIIRLLRMIIELLFFLNLRYSEFLSKYRLLMVTLGLDLFSWLTCG